MDVHRHPGDTCRATRCLTSVTHWNCVYKSLSKHSRPAVDRWPSTMCRYTFKRAKDVIVLHPNMYYGSEERKMIALYSDSLQYRWVLASGRVGLGPPENSLFHSPLSCGISVQSWFLWGLNCQCNGSLF
jgi:hypothetical protein